MTRNLFLRATPQRCSERGVVPTAGGRPGKIDFQVLTAALVLLLIGCGCQAERRVAHLKDSALISKPVIVAWRDEESDQLRVDAEMSTDAIVRRFGPPISHFNQDPKHFYLSGHVFKAPTNAQPDRVLLEWTCGAHATDVYWTTADAINEAALDPPGWPPLATK